MFPQGLPGSILNQGQFSERRPLARNRDLSQIRFDPTAMWKVSAKQPRSGTMTVKRVIRQFAVPVLHVVDAGIGLIAPRSELPPFQLRLKAGSLMNVVGGGKWLEMGQQMLREVIDFCGLTPESNVVEIGCSCGIVAIPMKAYLTRGRYTGVDIIPEFIDWCQAHLVDDRFCFYDLGVYHELYNPKGTASSTSVRLPVEDNSADVVFLVSVFTHMLPEEVRHYLQEIGRIMKPGGRCMATMLTKDSYVPGQSRIPLEFAYNSDCLCFDERTPTKAVAFSQSSICEMAANGGMSTERMAAGRWDGRSREKFFHDMYVFTKEIPS
jgi:SAM-dependent methyltransferase